MSFTKNGTQIASVPLPVTESEINLKVFIADHITLIGPWD